jgi:hypothetical protein
VEDSRDGIERLRNGYGYGPKEAEAMYRLTQARNLLEEMYDAGTDAGTGGFPEIYAEIQLTSYVRPHLDALDPSETPFLPRLRRACGVLFTRLAPFRTPGRVYQ